ncbi:MAG: dihydroorotase [Thermaerobacter sp.]|nr:dihydroorotase [Thermaerobacter sp.]
MRIDVRGAQLYDPAIGLDRTADLLVEDGVIAGIGPGLPHGVETVDGDGLLLMPGFIDIHVHLRDPGETHKEDLDTGLLAAAAGGFTDVCAMPNTKPAVDGAMVLRDILERAKGRAVQVHQLAAITQGQDGERLVEMATLQAMGAIGFSDDGRGVRSSAVMRLALQYARPLGAVLATHAEDPDLSHGGLVHEGPVSYRLGLPGQPRSAETAMVARDLELLRETGGRLHICHISAAETVELVRRAKADGLHVTCEVTPHHLLLTDEDVPGLGALGKMNPPLRTAKDRAALRAGLADGTIDAIATDHAPHAPAEKARGIYHAPFGVTGLETAVPAVYGALVQTGELSLSRFVDAFTDAARRVYGLPTPRIAVGERARLTLFDPCCSWQLSEADLRSKSRNSAFLGRAMSGRPFGILTEGGFQPSHE